jgi:hypothetical protein
MAYQDNAFQTGAAARAFQLTFVESLTLGASAAISPSHTLAITQELTLPADAAFNPGGPATIIVRYRVFARRPRSFPALLPGENEALAEPVIFFHKDAQVNLDFTILNPDGTKYNLTGATVDLLTQPERGAALTFACSITDAANGLARRTVVANDFAAGSYQAQLRVTAGAVVFHTVYFRILVGQAIV